VPEFEGCALKKPQTLFIAKEVNRASAHLPVSEANSIWTLYGLLGDEKKNVFSICRFDLAIIGIAAPPRLQALKSFEAFGCLILNRGRDSDFHFRHSFSRLKPLTTCSRWACDHEVILFTLRGKKSRRKIIRLR
jgi:hypothetical protein